MSLSVSALDHLPALSQLQHVQEFDEAQTHHQFEVTEPAIPSQSTSHLKTMLPPVLISGGLPPVPAKLVKRIQEGSFVEMAELLPETLSSLEYGTNEDPAGQKRKHQEVSNIVDWVQCFGIYIAIISRKEPNRIADLIGYQSLIIQASSQCHAGRWVIYDRCFRLKASAVAVTEWSNIDITLWKLAFPDRLPSGGTHCLTESTAQTRTSFSGSSGRMRPVCLEWNETTSPECSRPFCRYDHSCYRCIHLNVSSKNHKAIFCPHKDKPSRGQTSIFGRASRDPK